MNERLLVAMMATVVLTPTAASGQAAPSAVAQTPGQVETSAPSEPPKGRVLDARAAVRLALRQNPTLGGADIDVERAKQGVLVEEGRYPLTFTADAGFAQNESPRLLPGNRVTVSRTRSYEVGAGLRRTFPSGGTAAVRVSGDRFESQNFLVTNTTAAQAFSQADGFGATGRVTLSQPLLRGAGTGVGELGLRTAKESRVQAESARKRMASQLARDVLVAYWEVWYAEEAVRIERAALELARKQEQDAQSRIGHGALAAADALTFSTRVAELEEAVVGAETARLSRGLTLSRLLGGVDQAGELRASPPPLGGVPTRAELEAALGASSIELAELASQVEIARLRAEVAGDAERPRLDVEGYAESRGVADEVPAAFERAGQGKWVTAGVGLTFEMALDDTRRRAQRADALLAVSSAEKALQAARDRVATDAALGLVNERASEQRLLLATRTRELAQRSFEAEAERFRLGLSIPIQVQQANDDVRRAELREARARVDVAQEQAQLQHYAGKLLALYGAEATTSRP